MQLVRVPIRNSQAAFLRLLTPKLIYLSKSDH